MKHIKKVITLLLSAMMILSMSAVSFAANGDVNSGAGGDGEITIKNAQPDQTYEVYRIFEAVVNADDNTKVSYKLLSGKTLSANNFFELKNGYVLVKDAAKDSTDDTKLSSDAVEWLKANYSTLGVKVTEATPEEAGTQKITGLQYGYYYVTTTTGTAVSVDTTNTKVDIQDKNPGTEIDKTITGVADGSVTTDKEKALAQVGTTVSYEVRIPIANNAKSYEFNDVMSDGLTYTAGSMKVYVVEAGDEVAANATGNLPAGTDAATKYGTLTEAPGATGSNSDVKIVFNDAMLAANNGKDIVLHYDAVVNVNAVIAGANPNTATINWGHKTEKLQDTDDANVYSAKVTVKKVDGDGNALEGAGFVLKNSEGKYYNRNASTGAVSWVTAETEATEIFPVQAETANPDYDADAAADAAAAGEEYNVSETIKSGDATAEFLGLADGTYTLVEKTVPDGYNKADDKDFTIKGANSNNFESELTVTSEVENNQGTELPSTGGIGTVIFYVLGSLLVVGCGIVLISKKRMKSTK